MVDEQNARVLARMCAHGVVLFGMLLSGCDHRRESVVTAETLAGGDATLGRHLIFSFGCGSCHMIPGVREANGNLGPPLQEFAYRGYIAGTLVNTPDNLVSWIATPQRIQPGNAMPDLGVTNEQAHHIAAYLYTLR